MGDKLEPGIIKQVHVEIVKLREKFPLATGWPAGTATKALFQNIAFGRYAIPGRRHAGGHYS